MLDCDQSVTISSSLQVTRAYHWSITTRQVTLPVEQEALIGDQRCLLQEIEALLTWHAGDRESIEQFFNRQLHERIIGHRLDTPLLNVRPLRLADHEVNILEEFWSNEQLKVFPRWHEKENPSRIDVPLIVFRGWDGVFLIDGQSRVNRWCATRDMGPHRVLVIEPQSHVTNPFPHAGTSP